MITGPGGRIRDLGRRGERYEDPGLGHVQR